ncbi:MAG: Rid family hydrolase [Acidimicrobiales bacterium]
MTALLAEARMTPSDIVSVTTYVVVGEDLATVMAARDRVLGDHRAASTLVTVPVLAQPRRMEIAIVASRMVGRAQSGDVTKAPIRRRVVIRPR